MVSEAQEFLEQCLLFDIEVNENNAVYSIGAAFQGESFCTMIKILPAPLQHLKQWGFLFYKGTIFMNPFPGWHKNMAAKGV